MRIKKRLQAAILLAVMMACGCEMVSHTFVSDEPDKPYERAKATIRDQQYDLAEQLYSKMAEENTKNGSKGAMSDYITLSQIYRAQGRYDDAVAAHKKYLQLYNESVSEVDKVTVDVDPISLMDQGKFDDALIALEMAYERIKERKQRNQDNVDMSFLDPFFGNYYMQTGNYEKAREYLQARLNECLNHPADRQDIAEAEVGLAMTYYYAGDDATAERLCLDAVHLNAKSVVVFGTDLSNGLTMLGRIAEHRDESDKALKFLQSALQALVLDKNHWGPYRVERADALNHMGRFYLKQGKLGEAGEAYGQAIWLRKMTATAGHPNNADAIKGLADYYVACGELTSASLEAAQALKILDTALVPTHPRIAPTLIALSSLYAMSNQPDQATPLLTRIDTILQKPLGPWKEDFMDTAAFYSALLKKSDKPAEAERLDQLQARQKDRR